MTNFKFTFAILYAKDAWLAAKFLVEAKNMLKVLNKLFYCNTFYQVYLSI